MNRFPTRTSNTITFGIPLLIVAISVLLTFHLKNSVHSIALTNGILADLLLTAPITYALLIRKKNIPKITIVPFITGGILLASIFIPIELQGNLSTIKSFLLPVVEIVVLSLLVHKTRKIALSFKNQKTNAPDFHSLITLAAKEVLPKKIAPLFSTEVSVIYYAFFKWRKTTPTNASFSYHKNSGIVAFLSALLFVVLIESVAVHLLLHQWSTVFAWVVTIISLYSALQLLGFIKSIIHRPIEISDNTIHFKYGILRQASIPIEQIASIESFRKEIDTDESIEHLSFFKGIDGNNLLIKLKHPSTFYGLYGLNKKFETFAVQIDDSEYFLSLLKKAMTPH